MIQLNKIPLNHSLFPWGQVLARTKDLATGPPRSTHSKPLVNSTDAKNSILHRSSRRLIRTALRRMDSDEFACARCCRDASTSHCLVVETSEPKFPIRVATEKPILWPGQPRSIERPDTSSILSTVGLSNFRSSDKMTQNGARNCNWIDLCDGRISGKGRNGLHTLVKPVFISLFVLQCPQTEPYWATSCPSSNS